MKLFKYLILPISIIYFYNNIGSTTEESEQIQIDGRYYKYRISPLHIMQEINGNMISEEFIKSFSSILDKNIQISKNFQDFEYENYLNILRNKMIPLLQNKKQLDNDQKEYFSKILLNIAHKQLSTLKSYFYVDKKVSSNDFKQMFLSFQSDKPLNSDQKKFIKQLCVFDFPGKWNKFYSNTILPNSYVTTYNFVNSSKHNELSKLSYYDVLHSLSTDNIDIMYTNEKITHERIKNIYYNFLNKINMCYQKNIINKDEYILLLQNLLHINTSRIFYKLGLNSYKLNKQIFDINKSPLYSLFMYTLERDNDYKFYDKEEKIIFDSDVNKLQNSYKLYKSVMNKIIDNLLDVLILKNQQSDNYTPIEQSKLLRDTIFKPIILGILEADYYSCNTVKKYPDNTEVFFSDNIEQEFEIIKKIKIQTIKKHIKNLFSKDQDTGEKTGSTKSKYIAQLIDSLLLQYKLPYEVKYKDEKNK